MQPEARDPACIADMLAAEHIPQVIAQLEAIGNRLTTQRED
jgi:hypothetical protein